MDQGMPVTIDPRDWELLVIEVAEMTGVDPDRFTTIDTVIRGFQQAGRDLETALTLADHHRQGVLTQDQKTEVKAILGRTPVSAVGMGRQAKTVDDLMSVIVSLSDSLKQAMAEVIELRDAKSREDGDLQAVGRVLRRMGVVT